MTRTPENPFVVLEMTPTLDPAAVKRAYFAAVARHPPHADPTGFRRIRDAYEALQGEGLRAAHLTAPLLRDERAETEDLLAAREVAVERSRAHGATMTGVAAFERMLGLEWAALVTASK